MKPELYLNLSEMPITDESKVLITKALNDFGKIQEAKSSFSSTIDIVRNSFTEAFFGLPSDFVNLNEVIYKRFEAKIIQGGTSLLDDAFAVITEFNDKVFKVRVFSLAADFFSKIKGLKLEYLDFKNFDHAFSPSIVQSNRANVYGDVFVYPDINYGGQYDNKNIASSQQVDTFKPAVYWRPVLEQICAQAGYSIDADSELLNETLFNNMAFPQCGAFSRTADGKNFDFYLEFSPYSSTFTPPAYYDQSINVFTPYNPVFYYQNLPTAFAASTLGNSVELTVTLDITLGADADFQLYSGFNISPMQSFTAGNHVITMQYVMNIGVNTNPTQPWQLIFYPYGGGSPTGVFHVVNSLIVKAVGIEVQDPNDLKFANDIGKNIVQIAGLLPKMTQDEFIKTILQMLWVVIVPLPNNVLRFDLMNTIPTNMPRQITIDHTEQPTRIPFFDGWARKNLFRYTYDDGDIVTKQNPTYAEWYLICDYEGLDPEKEFIKLPYGATGGYNTFNGAKYLLFIPDSATKDPEQRVVYINIETTGTPIKIQGQGTPTAWAEAKFELLRCDLLIANYYSNWVNTVKRPIAIKVKAKINSLEFNSFDFQQPVYIEDFQSIFYVNSVNEFNADESEFTELDLILIR